MKIRPLRKRLEYERRQAGRDDSDQRQINMKIERFLMIERNLFAFAAALRRLGRFRFALTVRSATAFRSRPHEVRFTRDATAPDKSRQKQ